jgi:starvation-inducible DNA-binding protein
MDELIEQMKVVLGTTFAFYLKAHYFHWNVEGPQFPAYHKFFQKIYEDAFDAVDATAEEIRSMDSYAPGSFIRFSELSVIKDETNIPPALSMVAKLQEDNEKLIKELQKAQELALKTKSDGLENFLQGRIDAHFKHNWMLKATIKA